MTLLTRKLPGTDLSFSELTLGTWGLCADAYGRVEPELRDKTLNHALALGVRSFDMAPCWGDDGLSERLVAKAVGGRRDEVVYITRAGKIPHDTGLESDFSPEGLRSACEASLGRLGTDRIDVWLLHNPSEAELRHEETRETAMALQTEGKVRAWGASVCTEEEARAALSVGAQVVCVPFNLLTPHVFWDLEATASAQNVGVLARSTLLYGMLSGRFGPGKRFGPTDHRAQRWLPDALKERVRQTHELRDHHVGASAPTLLSLALRFVLAHDAVTSAVLGPRSPEQLETAVSVLSGERPLLSDPQRALLRNRLLAW